MKNAKVIPAGTLTAAALLLSSCGSWKRDLKTWQSDVGGGLDRTVTLYDYNGRQIDEWSGKFDISDNDQEVFFDDADGKRVIIHGGIVAAQEK